MLESLCLKSHGKVREDFCFSLKSCLKKKGRTCKVGTASVRAALSQHKLVRITCHGAPNMSNEKRKEMFLTRLGPLFAQRIFKVISAFYLARLKAKPWERSAVCLF